MGLTSSRLEKVLGDNIPPDEHYLGLDNVRNIVSYCQKKKNKIISCLLDSRIVFLILMATERQHMLLQFCTAGALLLQTVSIPRSGVF